MVDLTSAARFLSLLDDIEDFTFQTFQDAQVFRHSGVGTRSAASHPRVLHGSLDEHAEQLTALNEQGAGIFVMVNAGDGRVQQGRKTCRTNGNVVRIRAHFLDLDGAPIAPVLAANVPPHIVVESSPDRWHVYWCVADCPLDEFSRGQQALAARFGGDPKVSDLARVMRVPGFIHKKGEPFMTRLSEQ